MSRPRLTTLLLYICTVLAPLRALAVDAIVFEAREITVAGIPVQGARARLDVLDDRRLTFTVGADAATLAEPVGRLTQIEWRCEAPVIADPRFGCDAGRLSGRGGPTGSIDMQLSAVTDTKSGDTRFNGKGLKFAGTTLELRGGSGAKGWELVAQSGKTTVAELRKFAKPWFELPADITGDGKVSLRGGALDHGKGPSYEGTLDFNDVSLTNDASTIVTDDLAGSVALMGDVGEQDQSMRLQIKGTAGQVLVGPVLFDFGKNPLALNTSGSLRERKLVITELLLRQKDCAEITGTGSVNLAGDTPVVSGDLDIKSLTFPAAYTSYLQITLAATLLGDMDTGGSLHGTASVRDNAPTSLHLVPDSLVFHDRKDRLYLSRINGDIYWTPAGVDAPYSQLHWAEGGAFGLSGGAASLEFVARGTNFALMKPTKLPILDGALAMDTLAMQNLGASDMEIMFRGAVEPISMPRLASAFGWPQFQGTVAASIPGVKLKDNVLTFEGNLESQVFGGRITGSNIRIQDPLGRFPQLFADVRARDLDLDLVTRTFEVGSITGRLEADVLNMHLFGWSPVSFDARLATPKGDKSRHRISAKAVSSLSNVGGGGGGVVQALQSGVLRFFDDYSYDKLGITCKLRNDICEMSGIEQAGIGYYIVKGAGIPRIDIVGNAGRVRWSQMIGSISTTNYTGASAQ